jgi:hypothetical protein
MSEPKCFTKGDHIQWSRPITKPSHTYQYVFISDVGKQTLDATVVGSEIHIDLTSENSGLFDAAEYRWFLFSRINSHRYQIDDGYTTVNEDPTALVSADFSTHAERMLKAIEKRLEGRILTDHEDYSVDGRSLTRIPIMQLRELRIRYREEVRQRKESKGQRVKKRRIRHRFIS